MAGEIVWSGIGPMGLPVVEQAVFALDDQSVEIARRGIFCLSPTGSPSLIPTKA